MSWALHRHDARHLSELLAPESVDLIVTSPPYYALRSYRDTVHSVVHPDGTVEAFQEHYDGQLGSEATPGEFIDNLIACTADWLKVLKPTGSLWVNLGDKYAGSGGHNNQGISRHGTGSSTLYGAGRPDIERREALAESIRATRRNAPDRYNQSSDGIPAKSRMGLPWRYALRCIDELGLILRADIIWHKPSGIPESVKDRVRISHEYLFHFTRQGRYFAAIDEVREPQLMTGGEAGPSSRRVSGNGVTHRDFASNKADFNPLGKVPGSVWTIPSEPLQVPDHLGVDHFAAYPSELVRRIILGWTPNGHCTACGEARRAVVDKTLTPTGIATGHTSKSDASEYTNDRGWNDAGYTMGINQVTITGYRCACPDTTAPTTPAVVVDPFVGTGTTCAVAHHLGRHGIGTDLSNDYLRLAEWRCTHDHRLRDKVLERSDLPAAPKIDGQLDLFGTPT